MKTKSQIGAIFLGLALLVAATALSQSIHRDASEPHRSAIVAGGAFEFAALKTDGSLWAQNSGTNWQAPLARIGSDTDWVSLSAGPSTTVGLKCDGSLWQLEESIVYRVCTDDDLVSAGWGYEVGIGIRRDSSLSIFGLGRASGCERIAAGFGWEVVSSGGLWNGDHVPNHHTLLLKTDDSLWELSGWGPTPLPIQVGTDSDWRDIATSPSHSLAIKRDGSLWAWGANFAGQLGDGTTNSATAPVRIGLDSGWRAIAAGSDYTLALKMDGSLWAWGGNGYGALGNGTTNQQSTPARIGTNNNWSAISAGQRAIYEFGTQQSQGPSVALKSDGTLWAWGKSSRWVDGAARLQPETIGSETNWGSSVPFEFRIISQSRDPAGRLSVFFTCAPDAYYVLYRGTNVTDINQPVHAILASLNPSLADPTPISSNRSAFYRVATVPLAQPLSKFFLQ